MFVVAAYLCLVNLDYAGFWHDEAPVIFLGRALLERGDIIGWDGRNLVGGPNGATLNEDLRDVAPPVQYVLSALGFAVFGFNETGARVGHALAGVLALAFFYLVLRQRLPDHPRLALLIFIYVAWSAQLLLYFRQARYYAVLVLCMMAAIYFYERYWRTKRLLHLAALAGTAVLAFFDHYASGAAAMLALAAWHLLFRVRVTTKREWVLFAAGGAVTATLALAYLLFIGLLGSDDSTRAFLSRDFGPRPGIPRLLVLKIWIAARELFTADWVSWPVVLWFVALHAAKAVHARSAARGGSSKTARRKRGARRRAAAFRDDGLPIVPVTRLVVLGALCVLGTTLLSVQPVWLSLHLDLRYFVAALPLLLPMKGLFTEWLWRRSKLAGAVALAVLLGSSAGAAPFNVFNPHTQRATLDVHLFRFVREIHRPYRTAIEVASAYLAQHAAQDDLVYVAPGFADRDTMTFYVGDRVRFCQVLDEHSALPRARMEALAPHLYLGQCRVDWFVVFGSLPRDVLESAETAGFELAAQSDVYWYPTQRPEINWHAFEPLAQHVPYLHVLRRGNDVR